jgi:large subunit ribosomal protein L30
MSAKAKQGGTVRVRQIKSGIGYDGQQKATLRALGLGKLNRTRELPDNASVRGMLAKIPHLVVLVDAAGEVVR